MYISAAGQTFDKPERTHAKGSFGSDQSIRASIPIKQRIVNQRIFDRSEGSKPTRIGRRNESDQRRKQACGVQPITILYLNKTLQFFVPETIINLIVDIISQLQPSSTDLRLPSLTHTPHRTS